jgi:GDSL-like Lipase/Acylhydrolase family
VIPCRDARQRERHKGRGRILTWILLFALLSAGIELGMRTFGFFLQRPRYLRNLPLPEDKRKLRILALGESTTDDYFAPGVKGSWPAQLEAMLNEGGIPSRVYNEGLGGTQSAFILARLDEYLRTYQPHLVISMMGVNDMPGVVYGDTLFRRFQGQLYQFRLFKLFQWTFAAVERAFSPCRLSNRDFPFHQENVGRGFQLSLGLPAAEVEARLRSSIHDESELAVVMSAISARKRGDYSDSRAKEHALPYAERAFLLDPYNHWSIFHSLIGLSLPPSVCEKVVKNLAPCKELVPDNLLTIVAACFSLNPGLSEARQLWSRGIGMEIGQDVATKKHYRILWEKLHEQGIPLIAMQYPTRPLADLQAYFDTKQLEASGITFVANEENFLRVLSVRPYKDVFIDRFAKTWGHTTRLGHRLIAENVLPAVKHVVLGNKFLPRLALDGNMQRR